MTVKTISTNADSDVVGTITREHDYSRPAQAHGVSTTHAIQHSKNTFRLRRNFTNGTPVEQQGMPRLRGAITPFITAAAIAALTPSIALASIVTYAAGFSAFTPNPISAQPTTSPCTSSNGFVNLANAFVNPTAQVGFDINPGGNNVYNFCWSVDNNTGQTMTDLSVTLHSGTGATFEDAAVSISPYLTNSPSLTSTTLDFFEPPNLPSGVSTIVDFSVDWPAAEFLGLDLIYLQSSFGVVSTVPEPASLALLGTALVGLGLFGRRQGARRDHLGGSARSS